MTSNTTKKCYPCLHVDIPMLNVGDTVKSPLGFTIVTLLENGLAMTFMGGETRLFLVASGATSCKLTSAGIAFTPSGHCQSQGLVGVFGMDAQDDGCVNFYSQNGTVLQTYWATASAETTLFEIEVQIVRLEHDLRELNSSLELLKLRIAERLSEEGLFASPDHPADLLRRIHGHVAKKNRRGQTGTGV